MDEDATHLHWLSVFHYILGVLTGLIGCFPMIHLAVGIGLLSGAFDRPGQPQPPAFVGGIFVVLAGMMILSLWSLAAAMILAGRKLSARRGYMFCMIVAALECTMAPFGTVLGVLTIVVLVRPSVKQLFVVS